MAVSKSLRFQILRRDNHACRYCGRTAPEVKLTVDHVVPEALGGSDDPSNLAAACADCNGGKSATPADAATVAQVSDDAERWARAMESAAEQMLADHDTRSARHDEFLAKWNDWTHGPHGHKTSIPLPEGWAHSVDRFIAAGLPMPVLLNCVERAMSNQKVPPHQTFRYMCGIVWSRIKDLQRTASESLGTVTPRSVARESPKLAPHAADPEWLAELSRTINCALATQGAVDDFVQRTKEDARDNEDPIKTDADLTIAAAIRLIEALDSGRWRMRLAIRELADQVPRALHRQIYGLLMSSEPSEEEDEIAADATACTDALSAITDHLATAYLATLPPDERAEWLECSKALGRPTPTDRTASLMARTFKEESLILHGMCFGAGAHGATCRNRAEHWVWLNTCQCDKDDTCFGHDACTTHRNEIEVEGALIRSTPIKEQEAPF